MSSMESDYSYALLDLLVFLLGSFEGEKEPAELVTDDRDLVGL